MTPDDPPVISTEPFDRKRRKATRDPEVVRKKSPFTFSDRKRKMTVLNFLMVKISQSPHFIKL